MSKASGLHLKYLTFDTGDQARIGSFWSGVLGGELSSGVDWTAVRPAAGPRLLFLTVPEPKTAKNRFHADWLTSDLDGQHLRVLAHGASLLDDFRDEHGFVAYRDLDGNEFCVVQRDGATPELSLLGPTFDTPDSGPIAAWWAELIGGSVEPHWLGNAFVPPSGHRFLFANVPEQKAAKNRCHPDLHTADLEGEVERAKRLGATETGRFVEGSEFVVFADPDGNEFCIVEDDHPDPDDPEG